MGKRKRRHGGVGKGREMKGEEGKGEDCVGDGKGWER